ncbi:hypothetical protein MNBD_CHLOROFLEXI01-2721 [hydrothermal vent metagenome]|uniref:Uncharacterized protein n=1 Tax=hydrothermal vent metagenome TaxID=652676 RepID=A0A3B0VSH9_9ZZZZ
MNHRQISNGRIGIYYLMALFALGALLLFLLSPRSTNADDLDLPPRENPDADVAIEANGLGARVHLQGYFSQDWPWETMHWQEDLWLKVQWYDEDGVWQDVDGWQGTFEAIQQGEDWMGVKEIWLADAHLGTGPYRWQIVERSNGRLLTTSDPFYMPSKGGDLMAVDIMVKP